MKVYLGKRGFERLAMSFGVLAVLLGILIGCNSSPNPIDSGLSDSNGKSDGKIQKMIYYYPLRGGAFTPPGESQPGYTQSGSHYQDQVTGGVTIYCYPDPNQTCYTIQSGGWRLDVNEQPLRGGTPIIFFVPQVS